MTKIICKDIGDKAGFIMLWKGTVTCGDDFEPEVYNFEVEFDLGQAVRESRGAYLSMKTSDVDYRYNRIYINGKKIGRLAKNSDWNMDTFIIDPGVIKKGKNLIKFTARNSSGGYTGEVDDIHMHDPIIIYAVE